MRTVGRYSVLLVDDDREALESLARALGAREQNWTILCSASHEEATRQARDNHPSVAVVDLNLDARQGIESGFRLIRELQSIDATSRLIVLTGHGSVEYGVRAITAGAANFLEKPADIPHLAALIKDGCAQSDLKRAFVEVNSRTGSELERLVVGSSAAATRLREDIHYAAQINQPLLICGETGTGKGLCALTVHQLGPRAPARFVRYQPNFSTSDLVNSDLFGHQKGAFTGAVESRRGLIAESHSGTLFLDEIDELPVETQVALLGVLQDGKYRTLGSNAEQGADFRLICASNQNVDECVARGKIRKDFFHRISHLRINIAPLRDRKEDIRPLTTLILKRLRDREILNVRECSDETVQSLISRDWPGNIRELEAVIEGAAYHAAFKGRSVIDPGDLRLTQGDTGSAGTNFHDQVESYKARLVSEALVRNSGNQVQAALELGIDRSTLRRILARGPGGNGKAD